MSIADDIADGIEEVEGDIPLTFTWSGTAYPITGGADTKSTPVSIGGALGIADLVLNIRTSLFGTGARPAPQQKGTYSGNGKVYNIDSTTNPPGSSFIQLHLTDIKGL